MSIISIVLADDNPDMLQNLREELGDEFRILGIATNGEEALAEVSRLEPDVAVLDIEMPVMSGLQVASRLREVHSRTRIVFVTIHEAPEYVVAGFSAGALGYVTKRQLSNDLARAIREAFDGRTYVSPSLER